MTLHRSPPPRTRADLPHVVRRSSGITLLETLTTLAVLAVLAASALPGYGAFVDERRLESAATRLAADLQLARMETVLRTVPVRVSFYAADWGSCYLVHTGPRNDCSCNPAGTGHCESAGNVVIREVDWRAADHVQVRSDVPSLAFDPLHGTCTPTGSVNLVADSGRAVRHVINVMGRVRSCAPGGHAAVLMGDPAC